MVGDGISGGVFRASTQDSLADLRRAFSVNRDSLVPRFRDYGFVSRAYVLNVVNVAGQNQFHFDLRSFREDFRDDVFGFIGRRRCEVVSVDLEVGERRRHCREGELV